MSKEKSPNPQLRSNYVRPSISSDSRPQNLDEYPSVYSTTSRSVQRPQELYSNNPPQMSHLLHPSYRLGLSPSPLQNQSYSSDSLYPFNPHLAPAEYPSTSATGSVQNFHSNIHHGHSSGTTRVAAIQDVQTVMINHMDASMNVGNNNDKHKALDLLRDHSSLDALLNSKERFDPPQCKASTRLALIRRIEDWANSVATSAGIFWLRGGAGAGKSAVAQSLAESFHRNDKLAASFFFFRAAPSRSDGNTLIPTLAFQLIHAFPDLQAHVEEKIGGDYRTIFSRSRQSLAVDLLLEPLHRLALEDKRIEDASRSRPLLIVIDGLDECLDREVQCDLLRIIAGAAFHLPYPLRFFITSRPESHITQTFDHDRNLQAIKVHRYDLSDDPDADHDIERFFITEFEEIRRIHLVGHLLPPHWPGVEAIDTLVERSSSHFVYASTVVRYIKSPGHQPNDRLQVVLGLLPRPGNDQPYAALDALFSLIFFGLEEHRVEVVRNIFGILYLRSERVGLFQDWSASNLETIVSMLSMRPGDVELLFVPLASLVIINNDIRILHKSLFDYLVDPIRSGPFTIDFSVSHGSIAVSMLPQINCNTSILEFKRFVHHCAFGHFNDDLHNFFVSSCWPNALRGWMQKKLSSTDRIMPSFCIFRALRRLESKTLEVIHGSTVKMMTNPHTIPILARWRDQTFKKKFPSQQSIEAQFKNWAPKSVSQAAKSHNKEHITQKEHKFWLSLVASINSDQYSSFSVDGEFFCHRLYYVSTGLASPPRLIILSYGKYTDTCCLSYTRTRDYEIVPQVEAHLRRFESGLRSHLPAASQQPNNMFVIPY